MTEQEKQAEAIDWKARCMLADKLLALAEKREVMFVQAFSGMAAQYDQYAAALAGDQLLTMDRDAVKRNADVFRKIVADWREKRVADIASLEAKPGDRA